MVAALAISCTKEADTNSEAVVKSDGITITTSDIKDNSFVITLAPNSASLFYSYLIKQEDAPSTLDPEKLYEVDYKGVKSGTIAYADANTSTITISGLSANTKYQVYAVAGSSTGYPSEIAISSVLTTDGGKPQLSSSTATADTVATLAFTENVTYVNTLKVTATYYAINSNTFKTANTASGTVEGVVDASGKSAKITFPGLPAGAYYAVSIPEGTFIDAVGNKISALESSCTYTTELVKTGLTGRKPTNTFEFEADTTDVLLTSEYYRLFKAPESVGSIYTTEADASLTVAKEKSTTTYTLGYNSEYVITKSGKSVVCYYPDDYTAIGGDQITFTIPAKAFEDQYGNSNVEFKSSYLISYGYKLADIVGKYNVIAYSYFDNANDTTEYWIAPSDDAKSGNVMFTVYNSNQCTDGYVYASFDLQRGTLTMPATQVFLVTSKYYVAADVNGDYVTFSVPSPGVFTDPSEYFGIYLYDVNTQKGVGWNSLYTTALGKRYSESLTNMKTASVKFATNNLTVHKKSRIF